MKIVFFSALWTLGLFAALASLLAFSGGEFNLGAASLVTGLLFMAWGFQN